MAAMIWGSSFFIMKGAVTELPPNMLMAARLSVSFVLLSLFSYKSYRNFDRKHLAVGVFIGVIITIAACFQNYGLMDTTPGKNAFLTAVYCVIVPFIYWITDRKLPDKYSFSAAFICIVGIGLISLDSNLSIRTGDLLTLCCGVFYALQIVALSKFSHNKDMMLLTLIEFATSALLLWSLGLLTGESLKGFRPGNLFPVLYLSVFPTLVATLLQNVGQKYAGDPTAAAVLLSLESVFGVLFSVIFYGEELNIQILIGFLLVFMAVITSETKLAFLKKKKGPDLL